MENDLIPYEVAPLRFRSLRDLLRFLHQVFLVWRCSLPGDLISIKFRIS